MHRAFTLIEMLGVLFIIGLIAAMALPGTTRRYLDDQMAAEDQMLALMKQDIVRSFDSEDFANLNLAAMPGEVPAGVTPTAFSTTVAPTYATTNTYDWFAKLAAVRGAAVTSGPPTANSQPVLANLIFNAYNRPRLLVAGPNEANQQRFLLISVMARTEQVVLPENDGTAAWFNAIWNTAWNTRAGSVPGYWTGRLTGAQITAWNGDSTGSNLYRLRVVAIVLPRFTLNISNNHPTANGYIYYQGSASPLITANANSGVTLSSPILAGRVIHIFKGGSVATATEANRFTLRENTDVLIQNPN